MNTNHALHLSKLVEEIWLRQLASFDEGKLIPAEVLLEHHPELSGCPEKTVDVLMNEYELLTGKLQGSEIQRDLLKRFPNFQVQLHKQFDLINAFATVESATSETATSHSDYLPNEESALPRFLDRSSIGQGATAVIEKAFDRKRHQTVALKRLHGHLLESGRATQRLLREAQAVARLHHPNIVPVFEVAEEDDEIVLVSQFIQGTDLKTMVRSASYSLDQVVEWTSQIADALHYAHENGVIHRDVKPSNILVDPNGKAMLIDFGLAAFAASSTEITETGDLIGTPAFMSPEMAKGDFKAIDGRTDVYSIGATLYFLLAGRPPFQGTVSDVIRNVIDQVPPSIESRLVNKRHALVNVIHKCMGKSPDDRYLSARELADDLRRFQQGEVLVARRASFLEHGIKYVLRRPGVSVLFAMVVLLLAFLLGLLIQNGQVKAERNRARKAEVVNRKLSATASVDAGRMAMQRGELQQAIGHFRQALQQESERPNFIEL